MISYGVKGRGPPVYLGFLEVDERSSAGVCLFLFKLSVALSAAAAAASAALACRLAASALYTGLLVWFQVEGLGKSLLPSAVMGLSNSLTTPSLICCVVGLTTVSG